MSTAPSKDKFEGWGAFDKTASDGNLKWFEYEPKEFMADDLELKVMYCGICATDIHMSGCTWFDMSAMFPMVLGHELVGEVTRVGEKVKDHKVGDLVGVGSQSDSCMECRCCKKGEENYCVKGQTQTYAGVYSRSCKGAKTYGGYADKWRGPAHFVVKIPDNVDPAAAAPMLCAGGTVWQPLSRHGAGKTAKEVGVVGIGGLGHYAVIFAKAMGATVTAITHSKDKVEDAKKFGADKVILMGEDTDEAIKGHERSLDLMICTSNDPKMPYSAYLKLMNYHGNLVHVGIPDNGAFPSFHMFELFRPTASISGSATASPQELRDMLQFAATTEIKPWIKKYKMEDANRAIKEQKDGKARYRIVLVNEKNGGVM